MERGIRSIKISKKQSKIGGNIYDYLKKHIKNNFPDDPTILNTDYTNNPITILNQLFNLLFNRETWILPGRIRMKMFIAVGWRGLMKNSGGMRDLKSLSYEPTDN